MKAAIAIAMFAFSTVGMAGTMWLWWVDKITTRQMVGLTLALSWMALQYSAITTLFVS